MAKTETQLVLEMAVLLGRKAFQIEDLKRRFDEHRAGAVVSCDESCFCWQVEAWFNRMEERGE